MFFNYYWPKILKKLRGSSIKNCKIHRTSKVESGSNIVNTTFGRHSFCGYNCEITNAEIGSFCSIANAVIIGGGKHPMDWVSMSPVFYEGRDSVKTKFSIHKREPVKKTVVGNDVWIGQYALIGQGIKIGTGAVIGMGSVVTKDIEPYTVVAGCPARPLRKRFDDHDITKLLESKWWEMSDSQLTQFAELFTTPTAFINKLKE